MREAIGKAGPAIHVRQYLRDANPRQKSFQPRRQHTCGVRSDRLGSGDVELPLFDLDAIEFLARCAARNVGQLLMQQPGTRRHVAGWICLAADAAGDRLPVSRHEIVFECAVISAAGHPDVRPA